MNYLLKNMTFIFCVVSSCAHAFDGRAMYQQLIEKSLQEQESVSVGIPTTRSFYEGVVEQAMKKHWCVSSSLHFYIAENGFDDNHNHVNLTEFLFSDALRVEDVFLLSRLSDDSKLFIPAAVTEAERDGQYLSYLAPLNLGLCAVEMREFAWRFSVVYRDTINQCLPWAVGMHIPIKTKTHTMTLRFVGDNLFVPRGGQVFTPTVENLFRDHFESLEDFLLEGVFAPKGLEFKDRQRKTGFGDVYFFGLVDVAHYFCRLSSFELGATVVLPTASRAQEKQIWEPLLGNGALQFGVFTNMIIDSTASYVHPTVRFGAEVSIHYAGKRRLQSIVDIADGAQSSVLIGSAESGFTGHTVCGPISEIDATTPLLADIAFDANICSGTRAFLGIGNYFYNVFYRSFRMGLFWDVDIKAADSVTVREKQGRTFTKELREARTKQRSHRFSWNLHYRTDTGIEVGVGSAHVVMGKNVPKSHEFCATFVTSF